jgi:hypothetical protein
MKPKFRLALGQINSTVGDLQGNTQKIVKTIRLAREAVVDLGGPNYPFRYPGRFEFGLSATRPPCRKWRHGDYTSSVLRGDRTSTTLRNPARRKMVGTTVLFPEAAFDENRYF